MEMYRQKRHHSRATHTAPQDSQSTAPQPTRLGPHPHSHAYSAYSSSCPQVGAPSASMAELYATAGPSGSQRSAYREKGRHFTSRTPEYEARNCVSTDVSRSSSSPERCIPRDFGVQYQITDPSSSAHRSHANNGEPHVGSRRGSDHLHGQGRPSSRDLPHFNSRAGTASDNLGIFEPIDYIRAWKDTLPPAMPLNASSANRVVPTSAATLATSLPKTLAISNPVSAPAPKPANSSTRHNQRTSSRAVRLSNRVTPYPVPASRKSSWLTWFGFGKKPSEPAPQPALRGRTLVHRGEASTDIRLFTIPAPVLAASSGAIPASGRAPVVSAAPVRQPRPLRPNHTSAATQPLRPRPRTTVDVAVQTDDQPDSVEPSPDPPSPVPSLSWLLEDDASDEGSPSEHQAISVVPESEAVEEHLRPPSPSTNIHSLFPPLPPHITPPEVQVNAVLDAVKSVYAAHPEIIGTGITLLVPPAFRYSCPEYYLFEGLQEFNTSYMRLMNGFYKLNVFYEEINRKPDNTNPAPEFIPIPSVQIPQASCAHRLALGTMLSQIVKFKWILHILYGTTVGMTGFLRAEDTRPISPEESQLYVKMHDDIRRFTDRARGSYIPPDGVRPKDKLDLDEVRKLVEMLILAGGEMFTKEMSRPIETPPTLPSFLLAGPRPAVATPTPAPVPAGEATTSSQAEDQLATPDENPITPASSEASSSPRTPQIPPPAYEANPGVALGSPLPGPSTTLSLPHGFVPTSHPQGGVHLSESRKREGVLWSTDSTIAKEMRSQYVDRIANEYPILSALLAMAGDNLDTKMALAVIVQKHLKEYALKERKEATSRDELWNLISGPEAFMGMADVVREVAVELSSQRGEPAGLDGYIMKGLVEALMKQRSSKPEFVQAFSALREAIPQPPKRAPPPSPMRVNADPKGKRKWTEDEQDTESPESPSKKRKREEDAKKMPPPPPSARASASTASSTETYTVGGVTIIKARASSSATTSGGAAASSGSQFGSLPRPSGLSTPSVEQNYLRSNQRAPPNDLPPFRKPFRRGPGVGGRLNHPTKFASPAVRVLPPLTSPHGHSGPTTASSSHASASTSTPTPTLGDSGPSADAESSTSSQPTEPQGPVWARPVHTIKRAAATTKASACTLTRSPSISILSSSASSSSSSSSSTQLASGSYTSSTSTSSRAAASSWSTSAPHSTAHETSETPRRGHPNPPTAAAADTGVCSSSKSRRQLRAPIVSGREGGMQTASGTLSHAVASSSVSTRRSSAAVRPSWGADVEMNDDAEFEEIDVLAID